MADIYAVCISVSQSVEGPRATAHLSVKTDDRSAQLRIEWPELKNLNAGGDPAAWLYAVLGFMVEDFDNHIVTQAEIEGVQQMKEEASA